MLISRPINKGSFKGLFCLCATVKFSYRNKRNGVKIKGDFKISEVTVSSISVHLSRYIGLIMQVIKATQIYFNQLLQGKSYSLPVHFLCMQ